MPFRRVNEHDSESENRGNFRELMELEFQLHQQFQVQREDITNQYSIHQDYLSKTIFNEIISIMADEVKKTIFQEVVSTKFFSIIIDECKDVSKFEQLSLCLRYSIGSRSTERFVKFVHLSEGTYTSQAIVNGVENLFLKL